MKGLARRMCDIVIELGQPMAELEAPARQEVISY